MKTIFARESLEGVEGKVLFLAGPSPRSAVVASWRKEAVRLIEERGWEVTVLVPEDRDGVWDESIDFVEQIEWEEAGLRRADCIAFWIPRDLKTMPAFTTNIEFGAWKESGKIVLGFPPKAPKMGYLVHYGQKLGIPMSSSLVGTIDLAGEMLGLLAKVD